MGKHQMYEKRTEELISPILEENHFELVDVEFVKEAGSWHLVPTLTRKAVLRSMT